jgi:hypothetical protein
MGEMSDTSSEELCAYNNPYEQMGDLSDASDASEEWCPSNNPFNRWVTFQIHLTLRKNCVPIIFLLLSKCKLELCTIHLTLRKNGAL